MNERINELAIAAGGHEVAPYDFLFKQQDMQKFAELIVRECAEICLEANDHKNILQYFGVEE